MLHFSIDSIDQRISVYIKTWSVFAEEDCRMTNLIPQRAVISRLNDLMWPQETKFICRSLICEAAVILIYVWAGGAEGQRPDCKQTSGSRPVHLGMPVKREQIVQLRCVCLQCVCKGHSSNNSIFSFFCDTLTTQTTLCYANAKFNQGLNLEQCPLLLPCVNKWQI